MVLGLRSMNLDAHPAAHLEARFAFQEAFFSMFSRLAVVPIDPKKINDLAAKLITTIRYICVIYPWGYQYI